MYYTHTYTDEDGCVKKVNYDTRLEAQYYKKEYGGKVTTEYEILDLRKGLLADTVKIEAESPRQAAKTYLDCEGRGGMNKQNLLNTGELIVIGNRTSKCYDIIYPKTK